MTNTTLDKPQLGDLLMDDEGDIGLISLIEPPENLSTEIYFVHWSSGFLTGYTTAHRFREIHKWTINVRLRT